MIFTVINCLPHQPHEFSLLEFFSGLATAALVLFAISIPLVLRWAVIRKRRTGSLLAEAHPESSDVLPIFQIGNTENPSANYVSNSTETTGMVFKALLILMALLMIYYPFSKFIF